MKTFLLFLCCFTALCLFFTSTAQADFKTVYSLYTPQEESLYALDTSQPSLTPQGQAGRLQVGYKDGAVMIGKTPVRYTLQNILVNCKTRQFAVTAIEYYDFNNVLLRATTLSPFFREAKVGAQVAIIKNVCNT